MDWFMGTTIGVMFSVLLVVIIVSACNSSTVQGEVIVKWEEAGQWKTVNGWCGKFPCSHREYDDPDFGVVIFDSSNAVYKRYIDQDLWNRIKVGDTIEVK